MKLHEIVNKYQKPMFTMDIDPADGIYGTVKVGVDYEAEGPSHTDHGDNHTFREYHHANVEVTGIYLEEDVYEYTDDGDKTGEIVGKKGTDAQKLKGWSRKDDSTVEDAAYEHFQKELKSNHHDDY